MRRGLGAVILMVRDADQLEAGLKVLKPVLEARMAPPLLVLTPCTAVAEEVDDYFQDLGLAWLLPRTKILSAEAELKKDSRSAGLSSALSWLAGRTPRFPQFTVHLTPAY